MGIVLLTMANLEEVKCTHTDELAKVSLAVAAIKLGVSSVPCLNMFSSLFQLSSCVMRQVQFGHWLHESLVGDEFVSGCV